MNLLKNKAILFAVFLGLTGGGAIAALTVAFESPVPGCRPPGKAGDFGPRTHPVTGALDYHNAVDLKAPEGTPYLAPADGTVTKIVKTDEGNCGAQITIEHEDKSTTTTCHLKLESFKKFEGKEIDVGTVVKKGDQVAEVGQTGRCTGPHSHLIMRDPAGNLVDAAKVIQPLCPDKTETQLAQSRGGGGDSSEGRQ